MQTAPIVATADASVTDALWALLRDDVTQRVESLVLSSPLRAAVAFDDSILAERAGTQGTGADCLLVSEAAQAGSNVVRVRRSRMLA